MSKLIMAWRVFWAVYGWIRQIQKQGEARLTPKHACADRLRLESLFYDMAMGNLWRLPKWLRPVCGWLSIDNAFGRYMMHLLKSGKLNAALNGDSLSRARAVDAMRGGAIDP